MSSHSLVFVGLNKRELLPKFPRWLELHTLGCWDRKVCGGEYNERGTNKVEKIIRIYNGDIFHKFYVGGILSPHLLVFSVLLKGGERKEVVTVLSHQTRNLLLFYTCTSRF